MSLRHQSSSGADSDPDDALRIAPAAGEVFGGIAALGKLWSVGSLLHSDVLVSLRNRLVDDSRYTRRLVAANVTVDGSVHRMRLRRKPVVGSTLDLGFPVVVTAVKSVAGGGVLVVASRADHTEETT